MVERATENAKTNQLSQALFFSQDLTKDFSHHSWAKQGFDALLIDPPRSGAFEVMQYVPNFGAKRIVYVSCNPSQRWQGMRVYWHNMVINLKKRQSWICLPILSMLNQLPYLKNEQFENQEIND